jgi:uncharacterized Zn-binding protein involved in type VI secretion
MQPAAREGDDHSCPKHISGPIEGPCFPRVLIAGKAAARVGDAASCDGLPDVITNGAALVMMGGVPAARRGDRTLHRGVIMTGCDTVLIGTPPTDSSGEVISIPAACDYLKKGPLMAATLGEFTRHETPVNVTSGPTTTMFAFPGGAQPQTAHVYEIDVHGHHVTVVVPVARPRDGAIPTLAQVTNALGMLSEEQLRETQQVTLSPYHNPEDAKWAKEYTTEGFISGANGGDHIVTYFSPNGAFSPTVDATIIHEGGHLYAQRLWRDPTNVAAWEAARKADGRSPSDYADKALAEDFAESCVMYALSKGTACEGCARKLFPARYRELDRLYPEGFPLRYKPRRGPVQPLAEKRP